MRILVLGGAGFIGRHACVALVARGHAVVVGSRHDASHNERRGPVLRGVERRRLRMERMTEPARWSAVLSDIDVVVNCIGILRPRWRETYDDVHHHAVAALGRAIQARGIRLIHVSALGLRSDAGSGFIRSKWHGERALLAGSGDVTIVRPSLLDGADGFGARWLRLVARLPVHIVPADAVGRIAPLDVDDLALALATLCEMADDKPPRIVELGGADARSMEEHLAALRRQQRLPPARVLRLPRFIARLVSHICDLLHVTPLSYGHLELMRSDNLPRGNALPSMIGRMPRWIGVREGCDPKHTRPRPAPNLVVR